MAGEIRKAADHELNCAELKTEMGVLEAVYNKVGAKVEALEVELGAPPRIRTIEEAVPPLTRRCHELGMVVSR